MANVGGELEGEEKQEYTKVLDRRIALVYDEVWGTIDRQRYVLKRLKTED